MKIPRTAALLLLAAELTCIALIPPPKAAALACCGWEYTWIYYSDASRTTLTGIRIKNDCEGTTQTQGTVTEYYSVESSCCNPC